MDYNSAEKHCKKLYSSNPSAKISIWTSSERYAMLHDLLLTGETTNSAPAIWAGFSDYGHPGKFLDGSGNPAPKYIPWFQNEELKAYNNTDAEADCAIYDPSIAAVKLVSCHNKYRFFCDW
mmetsp:Transcript_15216/g.39556  ORF Transcript_15216/g.39556 Transcript_15216/m.39556 type:complete len:121 (+) Transcript_15216:116-478(+)